MRYFVYSFVFLATLVALPAAADTLVRTADQFELQEGEVVSGNFLGVANPVTISGEILEDAILLGDRVNVAGQVTGDVLAAGVFTNVTGTVLGDVRVVGDTVTISGVIGGDVLVVGRTVDIPSDTVITGDVLVYADTVTVSGDIGGDVFGSVRSLSLNGPVGGGVDVTVTQLDLGATASVTESVVYSSVNLATQGLTTVVGGELLRTDPPVAPSTGGIPMIVVTLASIIFTAGVWLYASRQTMTTVVTHAVERTARSVLVGFAVLFGTPLVITALAFTGIGVWVAFILSAVYVSILAIACIAVPVLLGKFIVQLVPVYRSLAIGLGMLVVGSSVAVLLPFLPIVGPLVLVGLWCVAIGALVERLYQLFNT